MPAVRTSVALALAAATSLSAAAGPSLAYADTTPAPTTLLLTLSPPTVTYGVPTTISGLLTGPGGAPAGNQPVQMWVKAPGAAWRRIGTLSTNASGAISYPYTPPQRTAVRLIELGNAAYAPTATSGTTPPVVAVRPRVSVGAPVVARLGTLALAAGSLTPARPAEAVTLTRLVGSTWTPVASVRQDAAGHFVLPLDTSVARLASYRVAFGGDPLYAAAASAPFTFESYARDLAPGASGSDVAAVQQHLLARHYDLGAVDGAYGYETMHAVTALQKVAGLARTGVLDAATRAALDSLPTPRLRAPVSGYSLEVDLARQVVLFGRDGTVLRVLDTSTGSGQYFYENGVRELAATPLGHFAIVYKVDHLVTAPLGELYKPAYFNWDGYAIHGNPSVPPYPASHGCVRITNQAMDRLWSLLSPGLPVYIYAS